MSDEVRDQLIPVTVATPLPVETTPAIERANRLLSLRNHPGFVDMVRISLDIVEEITTMCIDSKAWDALQITTLKCQAHGAKTHHQQLFTRVQEAINQGIFEANTLMNAKANNAPQVIEQHDYVRQEALRTFAEIDNRVAGSYGANE